jgi:hypothetical protein
MMQARLCRSPEVAGRTRLGAFGVDWSIMSLRRTRQRGRCCSRTARPTQTRCVETSRPSPSAGSSIARHIESDRSWADVAMSSILSSEPPQTSPHRTTPGRTNRTSDVRLLPVRAHQRTPEDTTRDVLITRRSWVQIPPPPLSEHLVRTVLDVSGAVRRFGPERPNIIILSSQGPAMTRQTDELERRRLDCLADQIGTELQCRRSSNPPRHGWCVQVIQRRAFT